MRLLVRLGLGTLALAIGLALTVSFTAANAVPASKAGRTVQTTSVDARKPSTCGAITVAAVRTGALIIAGNSTAELVLGSAGLDVITAAGGSDCVVGGGGNDSLNGGAGRDVCIGGPGTDTFVACETQIQ